MAGRKPGGVKTGGRVAGTPNRKTQTLLETCEAKGLYPFEAMVDIALSETDNKLKFEFLEKLSQYLFPKRRPSEFNPTEDYKKLSATERKLLALQEVEEADKEIEREHGKNITTT